MTATAYKTNSPFRTIMFLALVSSSVFISCKKESNEVSFNPIGYWNGNAHIIHTAILNKADGKSRVYFRIFGNDTAGSIIGNGSYTINGNRFRAYYAIYNNADSIFIEAKLDGSGAMNGKLYNTLSPDIADCNLLKQ